MLHFLASFSLKKMRKPPATIARELAAEIESAQLSAESKGPYVNLFLERKKDFHLFARTNDEVRLVKFTYWSRSARCH